MREGALRRGDLVEVRSAGEILATLDELASRLLRSLFDKQSEGEDAG